MKTKIVMKVQMHSEKSRMKAKKIAAGTEGVTSLAIEGKDADQLVVSGEGVDPIELGRKLRKKVGHADLITVEVKKDEEKKEPADLSIPLAYCHPPPYFLQYPY